MARYTNQRIFTNTEEFYEFLREMRGLKKIRQYATPVTHMPSIGERMGIQTSKHIWTYGDRYYKLSARYYGSPQHWWVIAWWNGRPTEADVKGGDVIYVPIDLERALRAMRTY